MKWKVVLLVIICVFGFSFQHGGGGFFVGYMPGDIVKTPLNLNLRFEDGIFIIGGYGSGGNGRWYSGGFGAGGETIVKDQNGESFNITATLGFGYIYKRFGWNLFGLEIGLGAGSLSFEISKTVNDGNTSINDFESGSSEGRISISIDYVSLFPVIDVTLKPIKFIEVSAYAMGIAGYSLGGWKLETGKELEVVDSNRYKFYLGYTLGLGIAFGL